MKPKPKPTECLATPKKKRGLVPRVRSPAKPQDVYEQIRRLAKMRDEGLITPEEFEEKKRDLLGRI